MKFRIVTIRTTSDGTPYPHFTEVEGEWTADAEHLDLYYDFYRFPISMSDRDACIKLREAVLAELRERRQTVQDKIDALYRMEVPGE